MRGTRGRQALRSEAVTGRLRQTQTSSFGGWRLGVSVGLTLLAREMWRVSRSDFVIHEREKRGKEICSEFSYGDDGDEEEGVNEIIDT